MQSKKNQINKKRQLLEPESTDTTKEEEWKGSKVNKDL